MVKYVVFFKQKEKCVFIFLYICIMCWNVMISFRPWVSAEDLKFSFWMIISILPTSNYFPITRPTAFVKALASIAFLTCINMYVRNVSPNSLCIHFMLVCQSHIEDLWTRETDILFCQLTLLFYLQSFLEYGDLETRLMKAVLEMFQHFQITFITSKRFHCCVDRGDIIKTC